MEKVYAFAGSTSSVNMRLPMESVRYSSIVATAGNSLSLSCASVTQYIPAWDYYPYIRSRPITIFVNGKQSDELDPRFMVDLEGCYAKKCSLQIEHVRLEDAGQFVCMYSDARYISLTVLGRYKKAVVF